ncbi:hypothetical protein SCLCIDRAFT_1217008, partial [Scleroderma citrinum Foug A]
MGGDLLIDWLDAAGRRCWVASWSTVDPTQLCNQIQRPPDGTGRAEGHYVDISHDTHGRGPLVRSYGVVGPSFSLTWKHDGICHPTVASRLGDCNN